MIESVIPFIIECEKLKSVLRRTNPIGTDRKENSAEHSWTLALLATSLFPEVNLQMDQNRVLKMILIHDIVEIDAGDTFCYTLRPDKNDCEQRAAERIFGLLPTPVSNEFMELWLEFEACDTKESAFANALDRLLPIIQNCHNGGQSWRENGITYEQAYARNEIIRKGSEELWDFAKNLLLDASSRGLLPGRASVSKTAARPEPEMKSGDKLQSETENRPR